MLSGLGRYAVMASRDGNKKIMTKANMDGNNVSNMIPRNGMVARTVTGDYFKSMLMDILPVDYAGNSAPGQEIVMRRLYRDMYAFDAVSGSAVDLISDLPFSDFTLSGLPDQSMLRTYGKILESMSIKTLLPEASRDFLVNGAFLAYTNKDNQTGSYNSIMPQDLDFANLTPVPIYGQDPIIDITIPSDMKKILSNRDPRLMEVMNEYGDEWLNAIKSKTIRLDPKRTIYIPRRTFSTSFIGTSYLRRALPIWLIEKAIMRGTIDLSYRRQKSILHLLCVSGDTLINVDGKLKRIDSIHSRKGMKPGEYKDVDFVTRGKDGKKVRAVKWIYQGYKTVNKITTKSGISLKATENHPVLVLDNNLDLIWKRVDELSLGDYLCADPGIANIKNKNLDLPSIDHKYVRGPIPKDFNIPSKMVPELAYIIGLILSDGTIQNYTYSFSNTNKKLVNKFASINKELFNADCNIIEREQSSNVMGRICDTKNIFTVYNNSINLINNFNLWGLHSNNYYNKEKLIKKISSKKTLPWSILEADYNSKLAFIAGYIDGDGCISLDKRTEDSSEVKITSTSKKMLSAIQIMLLDMGFKSYKLSDGISLIVNRSDGRKLQQQIYPYLQSKHKKYKFKYRIDDRFGVPTKPIRKFIKKRYYGRMALRRQYLFKNDNNDIVNIPRWSIISDNITSNRFLKSFSYDTYKNGRFDKFLHGLNYISKEYTAKLKKLLKIGYMFDKVVEIKELKKKEHVYDLSIEKGQEPAFVANGLVVHNCGSDEWEPNNSELQQLVDMFIQADRDPTGAIIATRPDVTTNEIREPTSFWRYDESFDTFSNIKYKALGISDGFLDPSATLNTVENTLSTFLEQIRSFRELMTRKLFYHKIFPLIALEHNFSIDNYQDRKEKITGSYNNEEENGYVISANSSMITLGNEKFDPTKYYIPKIQWHKSLKPEADSEYMNILATLEEKGLPIPLRLWAAAGGQSIVEIMGSLDEDVKLKQKISQYKNKLPKPPQDEAAALFASLAKPNNKKNRQFPEQEIRDPDTGRLLSKKSVKRINERQNRIMATALANIAKKDNHKIRFNTPEGRIYHYAKSNNIFGQME